MDAMSLVNSEDFFRVLDRHPQVRAVIWGHIHQEFYTKRAGVNLIGTPSTCVQFKPGAQHFEIDHHPPAYRWLCLHSNGAIETGVRYVSHGNVDVRRTTVQQHPDIKKVRHGVGRT